MERTEDLKPEYLLLKEAAAYLRTTERKIAMFRRLGLLQAVKFGKAYVYKAEWLDNFARDWSGYDLSSESKILAAINEKNWRNKHESPINKKALAR